MRASESVGVNADIAAALKLVLEDDSVPHFDAESRAVDVALEETGPVLRFVGPFIKEVGEASLTSRVAFGGTG